MRGGGVFATFRTHTAGMPCETYVGGHHSAHAPRHGATPRDRRMRNAAVGATLRITPGRGRRICEGGMRNAGESSRFAYPLGTACRPRAAGMRNGTGFGALRVAGVVCHANRTRWRPISHAGCRGVVRNVGDSVAFRIDPAAARAQPRRGASSRGCSAPHCGGGAWSTKGGTEPRTRRRRPGQHLQDRGTAQRP